MVRVINKLFYYFFKKKIMFEFEWNGINVVYLKLNENFEIVF